MRTELIVSTYNSPRTLWLTLVSATLQTQRTDGLCVADDGSGEETRACLEKFRNEFPEVPLRHVWHEDKGFRKTVISIRPLQAQRPSF